MSPDAVRAVEALVSDTTTLCRTLSDEEWAAPSACPGWRVQDVVAHLSSFFALLTDPGGSDPLTPADSAEQRNEDMLADRRTWRPERVHEEYEEISGWGLAALRRLQEPRFADVPVCMGDIGTYPLPALAEAVCFDHLCHLVHDILVPRGPVRGRSIHPDAPRLGPTLDWMLRGLPQMSGRPLAAALDMPLDLEFTGAGGRRVQLRPDGDGVVRVTAGAPAVRTTVSTDGLDFVCWATHRSSWRSAVRISGDEQYAARILDRIRIA